MSVCAEFTISETIERGTVVKKLTLTPYYWIDDDRNLVLLDATHLPPPGEGVYRYVEGSTSLCEEVIDVNTKADQWFVYESGSDQRLAEGKWASDDIWTACDYADLAASQWYDVPGSVRDQISLPTQHYGRTSKIATHCTHCRQPLAYEGAAGMKCPTHGWNYK